MTTLIFGKSDQATKHLDVFIVVSKKEGVFAFLLCLWNFGMKKMEISRKAHNHMNSYFSAFITKQKP